MINLFLKFNFWLESKTESKPKAQRTLLSKIVLNGFKLICRYMVYWELSLRRLLGLVKVKSLEDDGCLPVVSLTTFPKRLPNLWMVLYCIFRQTVRPAKIVVTLIEDEVPGGKESLPLILRYFEGKGVEFLFETENLRPHNKYFYCRQKYPNRDVITIDDDLLYYPDTIERLLELHRQYPNSICTNRGTKIIIENDMFTESKIWPKVFQKSPPLLDIIALGYSAVYYPSSFSPPLLYNIHLIKTLSLNTDDLWLKAIEIKENVGCTVGDYYAHPLTIPTSQGIALQKKNCDIVNNVNDINWGKLNVYFDLYHKLK